jgi:hypothetical protein
LVAIAQFHRLLLALALIYFFHQAARGRMTWVLLSCEDLPHKRAVASQVVQISIITTGQ